MDKDRINLVADIVSAYVSNNSVAQADLPSLLSQVYATFGRLAQGSFLEAPPVVKLTPAVPIRKSITPDYIVSLEDGKKFKSLKRHLATSFNMTPDEYRTKWGLPPDYPMVAPNYAKSRSELAKQAGLGQARRSVRGRKSVGAR
jgi:predicted transcriptional regulator